MDAPFLSSAEFNMVRRHHGQAVEGNGSQVTIHYQTPADQDEAADIDPIYGHDRRTLATYPVTVERVPCLLRVVHGKDLKILSFGIVEVGDIILFFTDLLDLENPKDGKAVAPGTLYFTDIYENEWMPILKEVGPLKQHLGLILGNKALTQIVPCTLRK